ncbi:hypothetical protein ACHAO2_006025 [Verticillium nonalfalfae]
MKELRADQACEWILKDRKFRAWLASDSSQFLTFYGDMGCGKTVAASYVIDYLQGVFPRTLVLYTYSRTQASTNTLESIYMSLLIQLVERERRLKLAFKRLYDEEKRLSLFVDPMCSTPALESLLREGLKFFLRPLYIVLDGLDECDGSTCKRIIDFFNQFVREDLQGHRKRAMEGKMLRICATYLLLDEFGDLELFNDSQKQAAAIPDGSLLNSPCPDDEDKNHEPAMSVNEDRFFDPVEQGFGPLFAYTASFWTSHLQSAPAESLPSIDQLRKLSAFRSRRFSNWRDQYRRPDCTKREQHEMLCQDPLGIVALFGPLSLLMTMVEESDFDDHYTFHQHSLVEALKLSLDYEDFAKCHVLFQHPSVQYDKFFQEALACYHRKREGIEQRPLAPEWDTLFGIVHDITASLTRNKLGNALMCNAARYGCLPLLKHLLDAAEKNIMLMEVVLTPWREHPGADQGTAWAYHQSIARAARFSHVETIKFLLSWPGIEAHFLHRDSFGFNVFHVAAQSQSSAETVALLLSYSNVGVDAETVQGDTPLNLYAFDHNCNLECVRLLLEVGGADVRGGPGPPSPLLRAAMNGNEALCHMLVTVGRADPQSVLSLNAGEVPGLLASINFGSIDAEQQRSMERSLLKLLCGLAHIDVGSQLPADYAQQ